MSGGERRRYPRAELKWPVFVKADGNEIEALTRDISAGGAYLCCASPLKLNVVFDMVIYAPEKKLEATGEVVWSNIYGPDDEARPRGMGVNFLDISEEDRKVISNAVNQSLTEPENVTTDLMRPLVLDI
jgi:c-di-GMP-binding flagellar brake protein YcgR